MKKKILFWPILALFLCSFAVGCSDSSSSGGGDEGFSKDKGLESTLARFSISKDRVKTFYDKDDLYIYCYEYDGCKGIITQILKCSEPEILTYYSLDSDFKRHKNSAHCYTEFLQLSLDDYNGDFRLKERSIAVCMDESALGLVHNLSYIEEFGERGGSGEAATSIFVESPTSVYYNEDYGELCLSSKVYNEKSLYQANEWNVIERDKKGNIIDDSFKSNIWNPNYYIKSTSRVVDSSNVVYMFACSQNDFSSMSASSSILSKRKWKKL